MATSIAGAVLHVDLSAGRTWIERPPERFYRTYGGGSGMGMTYILRETPARIDAFDPANVLTIFPGVAAGVPISGQSRVTVNAKSPLTGAIGDAQAGGFFAKELKAAGFDGLVVRGKAPQPAYLWLHDGAAEIRDACHLWGKSTGDAEDTLMDELGDKIQVLQIGPSGEKRVRFACLLNMCNRAAGRTGMGAVMGSKNLRAVVAHGTGKVIPADRKALSQLHKKGPKYMESNLDIKGLSVNGTSDCVASQNAFGTLPTRNWTAGQFEGHEALTGEVMTRTILADVDTCYGCIIRCKRIVETNYQGRQVLRRYGGPEYETLAALGSMCGVADLGAVSLANQLCNSYGVDTISCGAAVAFAMECSENGLISSEEVGGMDLRFGSADGMVRVVEMICTREGLGDILAEGTARAAGRIGDKAHEFLVTGKGQEAPFQMPEAKPSLWLIYSVNPFGADHQSSEHDPCYVVGGHPMHLERLARLGLTTPQELRSMEAGKIQFMQRTQLFYSGLDSFSLCQFVWGPAFTLYGPQETVDMLNAATGWDLTVEEFLTIGERRLNMMKMFNAREGFDRSRDKLSKRFATPLGGTGPTAGVFLDEEKLEHWKDAYYAMSGWDVETGLPTQSKLESLGLGWIGLC